MTSTEDNRPPIALDEGVELREQYRIGQVLGAGSFGITYLAQDRHLDTTVAIKEYFPRQVASRGDDGVTVEHYASDGGEDNFEYGLDRFLREGRTLAQFSPPNIVRVRSYFEGNGTGYLVMDYYEGQTLDSYLKGKGGTLGEEEAVDMMTDVLDGLAAVHEEGVLHRDIDPQNIYRTDGGDVILIDFGAAREAMGERSKSLTTILKPGYAPYEQYHEDGDQGPHTDVYACAATLYKCLTGYKPPEATSRIRQDELEPPHQIKPSVSLEVSLAVMKGMAVRPGERLESPEAFAEMLEEGTKTAYLGEGATEERTARATQAEGRTVSAGRATETEGPAVKEETSSGGGTGLFQAGDRRFTLFHVLGAVAGAVVVGVLGTILLTGGGSSTTAAGDPPFEDPGQVPIAGEVRLSENQEMVRLPDGTFIMGLTDEDPLDIQEAGRKKVTVSSFYIDRFEVTNEEYRSFLAGLSEKQRTAMRPDSTVWDQAASRANWMEYFYGSERSDHPVVAVTWRDAKAYCRWEGKRLPTEAEWEYAARARRVGGIYPWAGFSPRGPRGEYLANFNPGRQGQAADGYAFTAPVGSYPPSRWGLHDVAGNVAEWVQDAYNPTYAPLAGLDPLYEDPTEDRRVVRGGSWTSGAFQIGVGVRDYQQKDKPSARIGFRCAADPGSIEE